MRPFSTFSLKPFLFSSAADQEKIKRSFLKLSRMHHPDMVQGEKQKAEAEEHSAALNADFALFKSPEDLLHKVLEQSSQAKGPSTVRRGPPPQLAGDYFELLEWIAENPELALEAQKKMEDFRHDVRGSLTLAQEKLHSAMKKFPFVGEGASDKYPWSDSDLSLLQNLYEDLKYMKSFLRDIEAKQGNLKHAHSN